MEKQFLQQQQTPTPKPGMFIQPKLTINQPNDAYEKEADAMADKVMRMEQPGVQLKPLPISSVQRKCEHCEDEEKKMQRKEINGEEKAAGSYLESYVGGLSGGGQSLPNDVRNFYQPRFGYDFSNVKLHTGTVAAESAQSINALAYTSGNNVVFNEGQYSPNTDSGKRLLGHELTHVVQQGTNVSPKTIQKLGGNPGCTDIERRQIHQAIFDARGWINNALRKIEMTPMHSRVLPSLRRNFGPTYGVEENISLITGRIRAAFRTLGIMPVSCDTPGTTAFCAANNCGWADVGSNSATICTNPTSTLDIAPPFAIHCILHESFHAAMSFMNVDRYVGQADYPGAATEPLLNADSYAQFVQELS